MVTMAEPPELLADIIPPINTWCDEIIEFFKLHPPSYVGQPERVGCDWIVTGFLQSYETSIDEIAAYIRWKLMCDVGVDSMEIMNLTLDNRDWTFRIEFRSGDREFNVYSENDGPETRKVYVVQVGSLDP